MNSTWIFTIRQDDEKVLNQAKKVTGISADHRPSTGSSCNEPLLTIWCEDDDVGCVLMGCFLELRGEGDINFNEDCEAFVKRRLRAVL
jgi:hypothetical protein